MDREDLKNDLIAYLYGEMSTEERLQFEIKIKSDPVLEKEFLELKHVRKGLGMLEDKEVMEPFILWGKNGIKDWSNPYRRRMPVLFRPIVAVAASLILLLLIGYLTHFSVNYHDSRLFIGFNRDISADSGKNLTEADIRNLIRNEMDQYDENMLARLKNTEEKIDARFAGIESKQEESPKTGKIITEKELETYYKQLRQSNAMMMEKYLRNATVQQQEYFQTVMSEFTGYLRDQRQEDLRLIRRSLVSLKENQDQQQEETQQILATLLNNVNNQNN